MADRMDDLFSPERLRESWNEQEEQAQPVVATSSEEDLVGLARRLETLAGRFEGAGAAALGALVVRLRTAVEEIASDDTEADETAELSGEINELLGQIEDLAEATELAGRRPASR